MDKKRTRISSSRDEESIGQLDVTSSHRGQERESVVDVACGCQQTKYKPKLHLGWVQCDGCYRYCHITCAGQVSYI